MARLPYADPAAVADQSLVGAISAQRGEILHLYQMLLHSPPLTAGWLGYLTAIRQQCQLPGAIRELVIMRVAVLNRAAYEAEQHAPIALAEGLAQAQLDALDNWHSSPLFDDTQQAVLALTDAMTRTVQVPEAVFADARNHFDDATMVELVGVIAAYNMVSRFLEALAIDSRDPR
ncbi:carboxymuconolactone decarboxylase family protein [Salinisphaera sp. T31B1]|uniref:carboxymuconolactone decarboxylase family protein n=1 Tax=Salinisphaera sp. T31B1 TaxID=727963 RepID=UPI00333E4EA9